VSLCGILGLQELSKEILVIQKTHKKKKPGKPGRPATGQIPGRSIRLPEEIWLAIDEWRRVQPDIPTRTESIRRLLKIALYKGK
jgi:hypothetical protein